MFQISCSVAPKKAVSSLSILAAMGAAGMVAQEATADTFDLEPTKLVRALNTKYAYMEVNWQNWYPLASWNLVGRGYEQNDFNQPKDDWTRAFASWNIDFSAGPITSAHIRLAKNNAGQIYGVPEGAHINFALINEDFQVATPKAGDPDGPNVGATLGTEVLELTAPAGGYATEMLLDITALIQHWQANPTSYFGVRFYVTDYGGGFLAPQNPDAGMRTGDLLLVQTVPEPASLGVVGLGATLCLSRRRRRRNEQEEPLQT